MTDLDKLRMWDDPGETVCAEAAAEIERLLAENEALQDRVSELEARIMNS